MNATNTTYYFDPYYCTYSNCSVKEYGQIQYIPSLPGNALYLSIFALLLLIQLILGIRHRTWGFLSAVAPGLLLEIAGYTGRILLHQNDFSFNNFIIYIVCLTIGPAFLSAAIYLILARVIAIYGTGLSAFEPRTITCFFMFCDFVSLVLQAAGGAIASGDSDVENVGINLMIAGLATQVASTFAFVCLCILLAWNVHRNPHQVNQNSRALRKSIQFRLFLWATATATLAILIRCCFRVAELSGGFGGSLANNEVSFMILEGAMIIIASFCLSACHPGPVLGGMWKAGGFRLRKGKSGSGLLNGSPVQQVEERVVEVKA